MFSHQLSKNNLNNLADDGLLTNERTAADGDSGLLCDMHQCNEVQIPGIYYINIMVIWTFHNPSLHFPRSINFFNFLEN